MFFVHTDYSKEIQKARIHLAQPNKKIISHIFERREVNLSVKLGNIYELNFSIPHHINDEHEVTKNPHVDMMKEKMLLMLTLSGMTEWFVIDSIDEDGSDVDVFNVTAFSLGYELSHKRVNSYLAEGKSCKSIATELLSTTTWKVDSIDPEIQYRSAELTADNETKRTLEINGSNVLDGVFQIAEAFGAVPIFNSSNKTISFRSLKKIGTFRGMTIDYGRLLSHINRSRTTDEMTTRLYAFGNEDLTIAGVNPTGQMYIEDFSFFMYPFERDANKNVIKSSHYMSDALCHAILNHKELVERYSPEIKSLMNSVLDKQLSLQTEKTNLTELRLELQNIEYRLDTAKASEDQSLISSIESERYAKQLELSNQETLVLNMESTIDAEQARIDTLRESIATDAGFTTELYDELNYYQIEKEWRDDRYIDATELYEDALKKFISLREPKVVLTVDIENLFDVIEEQYYWDKLVLGDLIKIKYPQMDIEYMAQIIEINYDFEAGTISIVIANTEKTGSEMDRLQELLSKSQSASTILDNNKYKWNKVVQIEDEVYRLIEDEWDANKRKIVAGVNNQIEIGNRGIIIRNPDRPNEVVIMQAGIIALSMDGGNTWKTAIKPEGIIAERVIGNLIAGRNLIITNGSKTFTVDEDGVRIVGASLEITGGLPVSQLDQDYVNSVNFEINESKEAIDSLVRELEYMFEDSQITELEARTLELSLKRAVSESKDIINIATTLSITVENNNYKTALTALETYLNDKYINQASYPIPVTDTDRREIDLKFTDVEDKKSILINEIAKRREDNANRYTLNLISEVNEDIGQLSSQLNDLDGYIDGSFKDGVIETSEAKAIASYINTLSSEKLDLDKRYDEIYNNIYLVDTTVKSELSGAKTKHDTAHSSLITSINTAIADGRTNATEKQDVDNKFSTYRTTLAELTVALEKSINAISLRTSNIAEQNAKAYTDSLRDSVNTEMEEVLSQLDDLSIYIGDSFRDGVIEESEAIAIEKYINVLSTERADLDKKYSQIYNNSNLVDSSVKYALELAKESYNNAHISLIESINTAISDSRTTTSEKIDVDTKFNAYRISLSNLSAEFEKAIDAIGAESSRKAEDNAKKYTDTIKASIDEEMSDVIGRLDDLNIYIGDSFRDGIIEESEAQTIGAYLNSLTTEKADLDNRYTFVYGNTSLVDATSKTALSNAKTAYNTAHQNLITSINTAIADRRTTKEEKDDVDAKFASYKTALASLSTAFEKAIDAIGIEKARVAELNAKNASVGKGEVLNGVKIDAENGMVVTTTDNKTKVITNATKGFTIQKNVGTTSSPSYSDIFGVDTNGNILMKSGVISWGDVNAPTAVQTGALPSTSPMLTNITSTGVYTGTVTTNQLVAGTAKISTAMIESLVVGTNVTMGSDAYISWGNITSKPTIPTSASQVGAIPSTYIDSSGIWTGYLNASKITTGTFSADFLSGGTITGVTISGVIINGATINGGNINVSSDVFIGNNLYLSNGASWQQERSIIFAQSASMTYKTDTLNISAVGTVELYASSVLIRGALDLRNTNTIHWGSNRPTAVFG